MIPQNHTYRGAAQHTPNPKITCDGHPFNWYPSLEWRAESLIPLDWGYYGDPPRQLALALLLDVGIPPYQALNWYKRFAREVVAHFDEEWELTSLQIHEWMARILLLVGDDPEDSCSW